MWCMVYISLYTQISRLNGFKLRDFYFFRVCNFKWYCNSFKSCNHCLFNSTVIACYNDIGSIFFWAGELLIPTTLAYLHIVVPNCGISKACIIWLVNQVYYLCEGDAVCSILILRQTYILLLSYINL